MIPTIESMKMIGFPASVSATKTTPTASNGVAPVARIPAQIPHTAAPRATPPARPAAAARMPARPRSATVAAAPTSRDR